MLATTDLWFRYQDEPVLKGLTLDFSRHAVTGLVGANGCGKSTLRKIRTPSRAMNITSRSTRRTHGRLPPTTLSWIWSICRWA